MAIITLLTDFGTRDSYVGEVKGVLLALAPEATVVDVTHEIPPGDVARAAYILGRVWERYPEGTIHMAVVDPGVGTARAGLAMRAGGHGFVGPDNGILSAPLKGRPAELVELAVPVEASATFHGRDLFAPAAAALARGVPLVHLGHPYAQIPRKLTTAEPRQDEEGGGVIGEVVYVDRFGNLITNLTPDLVPVDAVVVTEVLEIGPLRTTFGDVPSGRVLAYLGSGGEIEIGVRDGSAARVLGMGVGAKVRARFVNGER